MSPDHDKKDAQKNKSPHNEKQYTHFVSKPLVKKNISPAAKNRPPPKTFFDGKPPTYPFANPGKRTFSAQKSGYPRIVRGHLYHPKSSFIEWSYVVVAY